MLWTTTLIAVHCGVVLGLQRFGYIERHASAGVYLGQNYPNPFNPTTTIPFRLPCRSRFTLAVFDVMRRQVATLVTDEAAGGLYEVQFNANNLASGVYFYRMQAGGYTETRTLYVLKSMEAA